MNKYDFSKKNYLTHKSQNKSFIISLAFCLYLLFQYFNLAYLPELKARATGFRLLGIDLSTNIISLLSIVMILVIGCAIWLLFQIFIERMKKEEVILMLGGANIDKISQYIFYQILQLFKIAVPLGFAFFVVINPLFILLLNVFLKLRMPLFHFSGEMISLVLISFVCIIIGLLLATMGFVYRTSLINVLNEMNTTNTDLPVIELKFPSIIYFILFIVLGYLLGNSEETKAILMIGAIGLSVYYKMLNTFCFKCLERYRKKQFNPFKKIELSFIGRDLMIHSKALSIQLFALVFFSQLIYTSLKYQALVIVFSYTLFVVMVLSIFLLNLTEKKNKHFWMGQYKHLHELGYGLKEIKKMINHEINHAYVIHVVFSLFYGVCLFSQVKYYSIYLIVVMVVYFISYLMSLKLRIRIIDELGGE